MMGQNRQLSTAPVVYDTDYQAILDRATVQGFTQPGDAVKLAGSNLITALKAASAWTIIDVLYVYATDGSNDFALLNWKSPSNFQGVRTNSPTFTSLEGYTGTGTEYLTFGGWDTQTNGVNYTLNNCSIFAYTRTGNLGLATAQSLVGGPPQQHLGYTSSVGTTTRLNSATAQTIAAVDAKGFLSANRTASNSVNTFLNGTNIGTTATTAAAVSTTDFTALARGGASQFYAGQISIAGVGANTTSAQTAMTAAFEAYMDALGKGVV